MSRKRKSFPDEQRQRVAKVSKEGTDAAMPENHSVAYQAQLLYEAEYGVAFPYTEQPLDLDVYDMLWSVGDGSTTNSGSRTTSTPVNPERTSVCQSQRKIGRLKSGIKLDYISQDPSLNSLTDVVSGETLLSQFLETYLESLVSQEVPMAWINEFRTRARQYPPLQHACLAISTSNARIAPATKHKVHPDLAMIHFGYSLQALQKDLADPLSGHSDDNMVTGLFLATFELIRGESREMLQTHFAGGRNYFLM